MIELYLLNKKNDLLELFEGLVKKKKQIFEIISTIPTQLFQLKLIKSCLESKMNSYEIVNTLSYNS
jgi:hypothetical protein